MLSDIRGPQYNVKVTVENTELYVDVGAFREHFEWIPVLLINPRLKFIQAKDNEIGCKSYVMLASQLS